MKKLSILLAGVCLTAALYSAGTTYGQNKTNSAKQKEDTVTTNKYQGVTIKDKAKGLFDIIPNFIFGFMLASQEDC